MPVFHATRSLYGHVWMHLHDNMECTKCHKQLPIIINPSEPAWKAATVSKENRALMDKVDCPVKSTAENYISTVAYSG